MSAVVRKLRELFGFGPRRSVDEIVASINAGTETSGSAKLRKSLGIRSCTCPPDKREPAHISRFGGGFVVPGTTTTTTGVFGCARCRTAMFLDQFHEMPGVERFYGPPIEDRPNDPDWPSGARTLIIPDRYDVIERRPY